MMFVSVFRGLVLACSCAIAMAGLIFALIQVFCTSEYLAWLNRVVMHPIVGPDVLLSGSSNLSKSLSLM